MSLAATLGVILVGMVVMGIVIYTFEKSTKETEKMIDRILASRGARWIWRTR